MNRLIGESTLRRLGGRFVTEPVGAHSVKGKEERISIYRVLGRAGPSGEVYAEV